MSSLKIYDNDISDYYTVLIDKTWNLTDVLDDTSKFTCTIVDLVDFDSTKLVCGLSARFYDNDGNKVFEGIINNVRDSITTYGYLTYDCTIVDNSAIANKRFVSEAYTEEYAGDIFKDILSEYLADEGVTEGTIENGLIINRAVFNYKRASDIFTYLKDVCTGYYWNIDKDKKLNFKNRLNNKSAITISDSSFPTYGISNFNRNRTLNNYRNTQVFRGGNRKTVEQTDELLTPKPDGISRIFTSRYRLSDKPTIEINLNGAGWVEVDSSDVGILGQDQDKKFYYSVGTNQITQDDSETVLTDNDSIRITYIGLIRLVMVDDLPNEIEERAEIEGNTGIYENVYINEAVDDIDQAIEVSKSLLNKFCNICDTITFNTIQQFEVGELLKVELSIFNINEWFLIDSLSMRYNSKTDHMYTIKMIDGANIGGWEKLFKSLFNNTESINIDSNEILFKLIRFNEEIYGTGSYGIDILDALYPANDLYPRDSPDATLTKEVTTALGDGYVRHEIGTSNYVNYNSNNNIYFHESDGTYRRKGFALIEGINISKDSTINEARVNVYVSANGASSIFRIYAVDKASPSVPVNPDSDVYNATYTTAYTDETFSGTGAKQSTDIKSIIQELVNRSDWVSGNNILLIFEARGTSQADCDIIFSAYEDVANDNVELYIDYTDSAITGLYPCTLLEEDTVND